MDCWSSSCSKAALLNSLADDGSRTCWRCRALGGFRTGVMLEERRPSSSSCSNAVLLLPRSWWLMNSQQMTYYNRLECYTAATKSNRFNGIGHQRMSARLHHALCLALHISLKFAIHMKIKFLSFFSQIPTIPPPFVLTHCELYTRAYT